jgi:drug/metabolite transporter (DMT)-like permease
VITALLAMTFLGENLGLAQCIGGALVLGGILLVNRQKPTQSTRPGPGS